MKEGQVITTEMLYGRDGSKNISDTEKSFLTVFQSNSLTYFSLLKNICQSFNFTKKLLNKTLQNQVTYESPIKS